MRRRDRRTIFLSTGWARGLAHVVNILDPDVIVLGGGLWRLTNSTLLLPTRIAPFVFSDAFDTPVRKSQHGSSSGVRGAAWPWTTEAISIVFVQHLVESPQFHARQ